MESFAPADHPLRPIKVMLDEAMKNLSWLFGNIYADTGRESIPPKRLIRAQLLQVLYSIRSERQLVEQINYNLLYRWFVGLSLMTWCGIIPRSASTGTACWKNDVVTELFEEVVGLARKQRLLSDEHFSVDGTLIQARASQKNYHRKDDDSESQQVQDATAKSISTGKSAVMRPMSQRQTAMHDWPRKVQARKPNSRRWGTL